MCQRPTAMASFLRSRHQSAAACHSCFQLMTMMKMMMWSCCKARWQSWHRPRWSACSDNALNTASPSNSSLIRPQSVDWSSSRTTDSASLVYKRLPAPAVTTLLHSLQTVMYSGAKQLHAAAFWTLAGAASDLHNTITILHLYVCIKINRLIPYHKNNVICIAPYGPNFRGHGGR